MDQIKVQSETRVCVCLCVCVCGLSGTFAGDKASVLACVLNVFSVSISAGSVM